ncbi:MAG: cell division protein FtsZ [Gallionella sp.]|jgi:cell division protein FtsZ
MKRRAFIKQLLAMGLMTPSLNAAAIHLITATPDKNAAVPVGETKTIPECEYQGAVIKVIGVGGGGCNALNLMIDQGVYGVEFIAIDSDVQALKGCKARTHLQIDVARIEAERARIASLINDANMIFIVAGMSGETGTDASSLLAQISRELNILTIAVVTRPSGCEESQMRRAVDGITALRENVDSLIVVPIADLMKISGVAMPEVFQTASGVMRDAVVGIAEMVNVPGLINVDFADVRTVMSEEGMAMVGSAVASGLSRAKIATERAISSPLLTEVGVTGALGVLVNITSTSSLKIREMEEIMACVQFAAEDATVILGSVFDESMGDELRVTVVATGLGGPLERKQNKPELVYVEQDYKHTGTHDQSIANVRSRRRAAVDAMEKSGADTYEIPSFLRSQSGRS